jgi:hypothetical protein
VDLTRLKTTQLLSILGTVAGIWSLVALSERYRWPLLAGITVLIVLFLILEIQTDRLSVFFAGMAKFYRTFPERSNAEVFQAIGSEYVYMGVGFTTVMVPFRSWYEGDRKANVRIRLLLTDPSASDVLEFQARYEHNLLNKDLTEAQRKLVDDTARRGRDAITYTLDLLSTMPSPSGVLEVRLHRERIRRWMHFVDGNTLYVGVLRAGESGLNSPVMVLKPSPSRWSLFDHFREELESTWEGSRPVQIGTKTVGATSL